MASQVPSISSGMKDVYDIILPLFIPSPATFTGPLLDCFAAAHDGLMESDTLFTNRTDVAGIRVDLDGAERILAREESFTIQVAREDSVKLLEEIRQRRLRIKLREQSGSVPTKQASSATGEERISRASILKASRERQAALDRAITAEEEKDIAEFKRRLREAVLMS